MAQAEPVIELENEPPPRKSRKKLLLLLLATLLLLGGIGAGAWYFLGQTDADSAAAAEEGAEQETPVFVRLDMFTVNIQPAEEERYLQTEIVLRVAGPEQAELIKQRMPEIRNRLLILLSSKHVEELLRTDGKEKLAEEILALAKSPLVLKGEPQKISGVFFNSFIIQ